VRNTFFEDGSIRNDYVVGQDQSAWITQGPISDRSTEFLGVTDVGIIMFRRMIEEQIRVVAEGGDPINVHRVDNGPISLPQEYSYYPGYETTGGPFSNTPAREPDVVAHLAEETNGER
jgi:hypothetical protein